MAGPENNPEYYGDSRERRPEVQSADLINFAKMVMTKLMDRRRGLASSPQHPDLSENTRRVLYKPPSISELRAEMKRSTPRPNPTREILLFPRKQRKNLKTD